ncbi:MAG: iron-containing alcohol dehydrogenase [Cyclobacteriaceae bacterium]
MIFSQLAHLPIIFQVDEAIRFKIKKTFKRNNILFKNILVVSGLNYSSHIANEIIRNKEWGHLEIEDNSDRTVNMVREYCQKNDFRLLIAVGGGKVLDTVKRVAYLSHLNHVSVPTIISNDGLISPIAVITNSSGISESLPAQMPMGVFIDLDIIRKSPEKYLQAAAGDVLSNFSATNDWILAVQNGNVQMNDLAFQLSRSAAHSLVHFNRVDFRFKPFLRTIIQGQVNSGIAMGLAGSSRPCSGSEHLISHAIDFLGLSTDNLHGLQVASVSLFCLYLQGKLLVEHINYAEATEIPLVFTDLSDQIEMRLKDIFELAKEMRPGRYTVLDEMSCDEFIDQYDRFRDTYLKQ